MSLESDFTSFVSTGAASLASKVWPNKLPTSASFPSASYRLVDTIEDKHLRGASGLYKSRVQLTVWARDASSYQAVLTAVGQVKAALRTYQTGGRKLFGTTTYVWDVVIDDEQDTITERQAVGADVPYGRRLDLLIWWTAV